MTRASLRRLVPLVSVLLAILLVTLGTMPVGADTKSVINIEQPGTPADLVAGDQIHIISDIHINTSELNSGEVFSMNVDLEPLTNANINISNISIKNSSITNGHVEKYDHNESLDGNSHLQLIINKTGPDDIVEIDKLALDNLSSDQASPRIGVQYNISVDHNHTSISDKPSIDASSTTASNQFNIINGNFQFQDQATVSSYPSEAGFSRLSITVEDVQSNVDSKLVVTFEDEITRIAGVKDVSAEVLDGDNEIPIELLEANGFPGSHTVYLLPESRLVGEDYAIGNELPVSAPKSALAIQTQSSFLGMVDFENVEYDSPSTDVITVSSARLMSDGQTDPKFMITVHPLDDTGIPLRNEFLGTSSVLSGFNSDIEIKLQNNTGETAHLFRTNRYAAVMRLVDSKYNTNPRISAKNMSILPNSDSEQGFVDYGVSDHGVIIINGSSRDVSPINRIFANSSEYDKKAIYAGENVVFQTNSTSSEEVRLYQIVDENTSKLSYVDLVDPDTDYTFVNTTHFESSSASALNCYLYRRRAPLDSIQNFSEVIHAPNQTVCRRSVCR